MNEFKAAVEARLQVYCEPTHETLAVILGISPARLSRFVNCYPKRLDVQLAKNLAVALGECAEFWMRKYSGVKLSETMSPQFEKYLAEVRERAANWKPGQIYRTKQYEAGYRAGFEAGKLAGAG